MTHSACAGLHNYEVSATQPSDGISLGAVQPDTTVQRLQDLADCPCWTGNYESCTQVPRDVVLHLAQASHPLLSNKVPIGMSGNAENMIPMTRDFLCNRGIELSELVSVGDIIAVYLEDVTESWMLGKVMKTRYQIKEEDASYTWMGQMERGDWVLLVQKLEPTAGGLASSFFMLTDKVFPCWVVKTSEQ